MFPFDDVIMSDRLSTILIVTITIQGMGISVKKNTTDVMAVDTLAPCVARTPVVMVLI